MAETMVSACPKCQTKIRVPESAIGKKIRCKSCENVFVVEIPKKASVPEAKAPAPEAKKAAKPAKQGAAEQKKQEQKPEAPMKFADEEGNDDDGKAYGMGADDMPSFRCPQCANELEGPDAILCLECGFNIRTRTIAEKRRVKEITGEDKFYYMLPAFLCILGIFALLGYWCFHHFAMPSDIIDNWDEVVDDPKMEGKSRARIIADDRIEGWYTMLFHPAIEMPMLFMFLMFSWKMGRFAFKRLVLQPTPPEVEIKD